MFREPEDLKLSPENAFRDYGNLPRDFVEQWCDKAARTFAAETVNNSRLSWTAPAATTFLQISHLGPFLRERLPVVRDREPSAICSTA